MARSEQTPLVVDVLEGPAAGASIALVGREMPYRSGNGGSVSYEEELRTKITWYPGNRTGSHHIGGPKLAPTTFNGVWKERYLGEDRPIDLVEMFTELLEQGCQVRVSWQTIVRQGVVKRVKMTPGLPVGGLGDLGWEITFEWSKGDLPTYIPQSSAGTLSFRDAMVNAATLVADVIDAVEGYVSVAGFFVGTASALFASVASSFSSAEEELAPTISQQAQASSDSGDVSALPTRTAELASTAAGAAIAGAADVADIAAAASPARTTVDDGLEAILGDATSRYAIIEKSYAAIDAQFELRTRLEAQLKPPQFARLTPVGGQDFRELANRYYGDADLWKRIATVNGVDTSVVPDDLDYILIPLSLPEATDRGAG